MTSLAAIALTTPIMLLGMAAVALPIVAHLLNRRARQRIVFPTIRLLQAAAASQSRLFRLRRLLLLALRCLAIILIAWAFARPVWTDRDVMAGGENGTAVVLVIDLSASTAQHESGVPLSHQLLASATAALEQLQPGRDVIDVVFATAHPRAAFGQLIANLDAIRAELRQAEVTQERADLSAAIELARSIAQKHDGPRRILVFSDMQQTNWADVDAPDDHVTVVPIGKGTAANIALSRPRMFPARPTAGHPATAAVTVTNHSRRAQRVHVEVADGDARLGARDLTLDPMDQRELSFEVTFDAPRDHALTFTIGPDDLAIDNRAYALAQVVDRFTVALVGDDDPRQPTGSGFYLTRALSPAPALATGATGGAPVQVRHLRTAEVSATTLQGAEALILANINPLNPSAAQAVAEYVRGGGGLVILGGGSSLHDVDEPHFLPFTPIPLPQPATRHITNGAWSAPALRHFDLHAQDALSRIPILTHAQAGELSADALVLLRYADGTPAVAEKTFGSGRVALATFDVAPPSELPKHGLFVALLHGLVDQVRSRVDAAVSAIVGRPTQIVVDVPAETPLTVRNPGPGSEVLLVQRSSEGDRSVLNLPPLRRAGSYTVSSPEGEVALLAVNVDERESDLRRSEALHTSAHTPSADADVAAGGEGPMLNLNAKPLWPFFIVAALVAIGLELTLLNRWIGAR